jgi:hypothetical protein
MSDHRPEVADVIREYGPAYREACGNAPPAGHLRVLRDISRCRTAELGGHRQRCDRCGHEVISYNSCRNRHCPKCQAAARAQWLDARAAELLEVPYCHVVFTLPEKLGHLALQNKRLLYCLLFRAASETLLTIARDPRHLGARIGFLMILHTWGQTLSHHPHVHALVPAGGLSADGTRWIPCRTNFFLPVRVLSALFRNKFLSLLADADRAGAISFHGRLQHLSHPDRWHTFLTALHKTDWVVYAKPPFHSPALALKYLARYTHRIAIANNRLVSIRDGAVTFRWKDYAHHSRQRTMTLEAVEFIRRFLFHVLPKGFVHIRHYGFLANRSRTKKLALCRTLITRETATHITGDSDATNVAIERYHHTTPHRCPACGKGYLIRVEILKPLRSAPEERPP